MKLAIMQPYFFPYIGYFQLINAVDKCILYDNVNYIKRGWINRNRILEVNGGPVFISLPLSQSSSFMRIREIEIDNTKPWKSRFLKMIQGNYKRSPYFEEVYPVISDIILFNESNLSRFNCNLIKSLCGELRIETQLSFNSAEYEEIERDVSSEKNKFYRMHSRVIRICRHENADTYVNAIGGQELYSKDFFKSNGIDLWFLNTQQYNYNQNSGTFFQHMSIIDVLMNCGREETIRMLDRYELI